jgi:hypothetical protein
LARGSGVSVEGDIEQVIVNNLVEVKDLLGRPARGRRGRQGCGEVEVLEDGLDDGRCFDGLDRDHPAIAARAFQDIEVQDVGQQLGPGPADPSRDTRPGALATLERLEREARYRRR